MNRLRWVVENFFDHYPLDQPPDTSVTTAHHEIGLYLVMHLPGHLVNTAFPGRKLAGTPDQFAFEFRWFDRADLGDLDVRPARIGSLLTQPLPTGAPTVVNVD